MAGGPAMAVIIQNCMEYGGKEEGIGDGGEAEVLE